jgi:hypothetical protein
VRLRVVPIVSDDVGAGAARTAHPVRPAMLADQLEALVIVDQGGKIDQVRSSQDDTGK